MEEANRADVLQQISKIQTNTASVTVQIGGVDSDNMVEHGTLYIKNAPAKIISELSQMGFSLSVEDDGVRIEDYGR